MPGPISSPWGMPGPISPWGMSGPISPWGMPGPISSWGIKGSMSSLGMKGSGSSIGMQGLVATLGMQDRTFRVGCTPLMIAQLGCKHGTYVDKENRCRCSVGLNEICVSPELGSLQCAENLECSSKTDRCVPTWTDLVTDQIRKVKH
ncbi:uncharacterized protein [Penaeus vannamei]|uniref:uncharacterized protein n=1 Tax=Penaeus vannamei TaxID=6689 RepID=UPI00387F68E4